MTSQMSQEDPLRHTLRRAHIGDFAQVGGYGQMSAPCSGYGQVSEAPSQLPADAGAPGTEGMYGSGGYPYAQPGMSPMYTPINQMLYSQGGQGGQDPNMYYAQTVQCSHCMHSCNPRRVWSHLGALRGVPRRAHCN